MNAWIITTENHIISSMSTLKRKITCPCYRLDIFVLFRGKITGQSFPLSLVIYKMKTVMIILVKGIIDVMYKPLLSEKLPWSLHVYFIFTDFTIGHVIFTLSGSIFVNQNHHAKTFLPFRHHLHYQFIEEYQQLLLYVIK